MLRLRSLGEDMLFGPMAAKDTLHSFGELLIALSVGAVSHRTTPTHMMPYVLHVEVAGNFSV